MNKLLSIGLLVLSICLIELASEAVIVKYDNTGRPYYNNNIRRVQNTTNPYNKDLCRVEQFLYGTTYSNQNNTTRLNRIEKRLFNRSYSSMNIGQRMNNILANYRGNYQQNYYSSRNNGYNNYYQPNTIKNRMINSFVGQPTGYTPSITNSPYLNRFGPSYSRGYYGNNGWGYHNSYRPTMSGAGIHILD